MNIDVNFDIENYIFLKFKEYMETKSKFNPKVFSKTPKELAQFPTIIFKEINNVDNMTYRSLDRTQRVYQITDTIEIYTKDMPIGDKKYASKVIMSELKYLVFDFFELYGFQRTSCDIVDYYDYQVDRMVITVVCNQNNWNKKIS